MGNLEGLAHRLRSLREEVGLSQREVGEICGLSRKSMVRIERDGTNPTAEELLALAELYEVSVDYILGRVNDRGSFGRELRIVEKVVTVERTKKFFNPAWDEE